MENNMMMNSQGYVGVNVTIRRRDSKTMKVLETRRAKNRVTKLAILGIVRWINGEFLQTSNNPDRTEEYIPRYLALGTNTPEEPNPGVSSEVTVTDAKLLSEIKNKNDSARIWIGSRRHNKIESRMSDSFVKLTINVYIQSNIYNSDRISEAGLFTKKTGNNCWARVAFDPITKTDNDVIDITWEITVLSVGTTVYPNSIELLGTDIIELKLNKTGDIIYFSKGEINGPDSDGNIILKGTIGSNNIIYNPKNGKATKYSIDTTKRVILFNNNETAYSYDTEGNIVYGQRQKILIAISPVSPDNSTDTDIVWTSSDTNVAIVNYDGVVIPKGYGECIITGTTVNDLSVNCKVIVKDSSEIIYPTGITLNKNNISLYYDDPNNNSFRLINTISPSDATNKSVKWKTGDSKIAVVDQEGLVMAVGIGYTNITCTTSNNISTSCTVLVRSLN